MRLEHVNLTVADLDRSIRFYSDLLDLQLRWQGLTNSGEPAAHLGNEDWYLALFQASEGNLDERVERRDYGRPGINHFGLVVDDLDAARQRLLELGGDNHFETDYEPGRRLYFLDPDGIEVELVSYAGQAIEGAR